MKQKKITIVTPSFNSGKYIEDCIKSILEQNYDNFEHIIVDGGSNDNTVDILKKYEHLKWISEADRGQSDALNKGFDLADGDIIGWCNADDVYLPDTFKKVNEEFHDTDILYGDIIFTDSELNIIRRKYDHDFDRNILSFVGCYIQSATTFYSHDVISNKNNRLDISLRTSMDYDFFSKLASKKYRFKYVPVAFAYFRKTGENYGKKYEHLLRQELFSIVKKYTSLPFESNPTLYGVQYKILHNLYRLKRVYKKFKAHGAKAIFESKITANDLKY